LIFAVSQEIPSGTDRNRSRNSFSESYAQSKRDIRIHVESEFEKEKHSTKTVAKNRKGDAKMLVELRNRVLNVARDISRLHLAQGTSGNVSARDPSTGLLAITPTSLPYDLLQIDDIPIVDLSGEIIWGKKSPSSEMPMHTAIYAARTDVNGVVHTHSIYATVFAVLNREIPVVTVPMVEIGPVGVVPFCLPGSKELGDETVRCLSEDKKAILLQNHGSVCVDQTVEKALSCAVYLEEGAQIAYLALLAEGLNPIPKEYISIMRESQKKGEAL